MDLGHFKLLENITINDRSIVVWYNEQDKSFNLMLFHLTDQPNELSKRSPYTTWGYPTGMLNTLNSESEAAEVVSLYIQDIEKEDFWWEYD